VLELSEEHTCLGARRAVRRRESLELGESAVSTPANTSFGPPGEGSVAQWSTRRRSPAERWLGGNRAGVPVVGNLTDGHCLLAKSDHHPPVGVVG
jgi:hypothetical protein